MIYSIQTLSELIETPLYDWPGNCCAVATALFEAGLFNGELRRGHYLGPVAPGTMFDKKLPFIPHSWIQYKNIIIDPTRWVFDGTDPGLWIGFDFYGEYDAGGDKLRAAMERPVPEYDPGRERVLLDLNREYMTVVSRLIHDPPHITIDHIMWLANLSRSRLGALALPVYAAIAREGLQAFIPIDNWELVMGEE